jgi:hypothetical protein
VGGGALWTRHAARRYRPGMVPADEKVYEMLWDCKYCGTRKLLGKTHRHCPNCGGPQDAEGRYFPPDSEKVAVQDHIYYGLDIRCPSCQFFNGRSAKHCGHCGGPLEAGQSATLKQAHAPAAPLPKTRGKLILVAILAVATGLIAIIAGVLLWKKDTALVVTGHAWKREIQIESYSAARESRWCDELPAGATGVTRHREVRSRNKVADGEDCSTRKIDNGDGTFKEKRECKPRYKEEPVYADKCDFSILRWKVSRTASASGNGMGDAPRWPEVKLAQTGSCVGCEREGDRSEEYSVELSDEGKGTKGTCEFDENKWASFKVGSTWAAKVRRIGGSIDCGSLQAK